MSNYEKYNKIYPCEFFSGHLVKICYFKENSVYSLESPGSPASSAIMHL